MIILFFNTVILTRKIYKFEIFFHSSGCCETSEEICKSTFSVILKIHLKQCAAHVQCKKMCCTCICMTYVPFVVLFEGKFFCCKYISYSFSKYLFICMYVPDTWFWTQRDKTIDKSPPRAPKFFLKSSTGAAPADDVAKTTSKVHSKI